MDQLSQEGLDPEKLLLECSLTASDTAVETQNGRVPVASVHLGRDVAPFSPLSSEHGFTGGLAGSLPAVDNNENASAWNSRTRSSPVTRVHTPDSQISRATKRRKAIEDPRASAVLNQVESNGNSDTVVVRQHNDSPAVSQRKKRTPENPALQPSTLEKFINGVWESIYSGTSRRRVDWLPQQPGKTLLWRSPSNLRLLIKNRDSPAASPIIS